MSLHLSHALHKPRIYLAFAIIFQPLELFRRPLSNRWNF